MTREEAIERLISRKEHYELDDNCQELALALDMAIEALSAEPCEDAISFPKGTLKKRGKGYVVYNPEWLKENWRTELRVMGIECEDAISRQAVLSYIEFILTHGMGKKKSFEFIKKYVEKQPSVTPNQKMGHWIKHTHKGMVYLECSECGDWFLMVGPIRTGHCSNCGAKMGEGED